MAKHVIYFDPLDPISCGRANRRYRQYLKEFDAKVDEFLEALANRGKEVLDGLGYTVDSGEITVTVEPIETGYRINAAGKSVVFIEFGAGDTVNSGNKYAPLMPFDVSSGSFSEENAQQYSTTKEIFGNGFWEFGGVRYTQITPRNGMQTVFDTLMQEWHDIAKRIFE